MGITRPIIRSIFSIRELTFFKANINIKLNIGGKIRFIISFANLFTTLSFIIIAYTKTY